MLRLFSICLLVILLVLKVNSKNNAPFIDPVIQKALLTLNYMKYNVFYFTIIRTNPSKLILIYFYILMNLATINQKKQRSLRKVWIIEVIFNLYFESLEFSIYRKFPLNRPWATISSTPGPSLRQTLISS